MYIKHTSHYKFLYWIIYCLLGFISVSDWCYAMEETTHLGLPWRMLKDKLVRTDPETRLVRYMDTFELNANVSLIVLLYFKGI